MQTVTASDVDGRELERLDAVVAELPHESTLAAALRELARAVRAGSDVVVAGRDDKQVTPAQAAAILNMSRTHLYKVLDAGELPFVRVGRDRRIAVEDLLAFAARREQDRRALAERFAHPERSRAAALESVAGLSPQDAARD